MTLLSGCCARNKILCIEEERKVSCLFYIISLFANYNVDKKCRHCANRDKKGAVLNIFL